MTYRLTLHCAALGYLYSSVTVRAINPQNARAVLAAGCLLGGMDELCNYAYELCRQSITVENITAWLQFVDTVPAPSDGASTPIEQQQIPPSRTAIFGPFAQRLKEDVWEFLVITLPQNLNVGGVSTPISPHPEGQTSDAGRDTLLQVFALVPFDMFKAAVESPAFNIGMRISPVTVVPSTDRQQGRTKRDSNSLRTQLSYENGRSPVARVQKRRSCSRSAGTTGEVRSMSRASCESGRCGRSMLSLVVCFVVLSTFILLLSLVRERGTFIEFVKRL